MFIDKKHFIHLPTGFGPHYCNIKKTSSSPTIPIGSTSDDNSIQYVTGRVTFESGRTVRKHGQAFRFRREIEAMKYVQSRIFSIPIPSILDVYFPESDKKAEKGWILMNQLPGLPLGKVWPTLTKGSSQAQKIIYQLKLYLIELRHLRPHSSDANPGG